MSRYGNFMLMLVAGYASSCSHSLKVTTQHAKGVDLSAYQTFSLDEDSSAVVSEDNRETIYLAVANEMGGKGYKRMEGHADLLVNTVAVVKKKTKVNTNTTYMSYGGPYHSYVWGVGYGVSTYKTLDIEHYKEGSLIISVVDTRTKQLVWQGVGNNRIDSKLDRPRERIRRAVNRIMEDFPARKGPSF
jgi:hypothetical protein